MAIDRSGGAGWTGCGDSTPRDRRNSARVLAALAAWAILLLAAVYGIRHGLVPAGPVSWLVAGIPPLALLGAFGAYAVYLRDADELQRSIQLRALALGFGAGYFAILGYPLFERLGAPALDAQDYALVMAVFFTLGIVLGRKRYG